MQTKGFKSQLPSNVITNVAYVVIKIIIGLWLVPFFIINLGIEAYGFIQLATQITFFATIITLTLNSAVSRYLTINFQQNNILEANKTFNTSIIISATVILILLPFSFGISYFLDFIFHIPVNLINSPIYNVPYKLINDSRILFFIVFLSFLITFFSNPFSASTTSQNRIDLSNLTNIINVIVQTALVVFLFYIITPSLTSVGISFLIAALATLLASYIICKKITPELKINTKFFEKSRVGNLTAMSAWLTINQVGTILFLNFDLILINWVFKDSALQGKYAALLQMSILLRNLSFIVSRATGPMVYISYAKNEIHKMVSIMKSSVKFMGIFLALPIGIICGFAYPFLHIWLGQEYTQYVPLLWLIIIPLIINLGIQPLYSISIACNKVKLPGIVTLVLGLVNVLLAIILAKTTNLGLYAIALASAIVLTLKNIIFIAIYSAHIININRLTFLKPVFTGLILTIAIFIVSFALEHFVNIQSWFSLLIYSCLVSICFLPVIWFYIIDKSERDNLKSIIVNVFDK